MSQYDGCPDENCDGCEGTEPYFQNLPKPPPFARTNEEFLNAMNGVFDKYPGMRINAPLMINVMMQTLNVKPHEFREAQDMIYDFLASQKHAGVISVLKGKNGGMMKNHVSSNPLLAPIETKKTIAGPVRYVGEVAPAINDHTCPSCGNTSCSKSERTCWKCGNAL